ncbi:WYL domain-containing protein [Aromatoleum toluvorans]|nr:WYL domain-containing protein [Aromatoleum toluvorans]
MGPQRDIQRERLFYIEFLALFVGQVSRKDLVSRFGISEPAATKDLSLYAELVPGMLRYDLRQKCYVLGEGEPYFEHDPEQALYSLAGERAIAMDTEHARRLPSWVNSSIKRDVPLSVVAAITRCIYQRRKMAVRYGSLSTGARERVLSPVALVNDGLRWHIRCFAHEHDEFRDYNLARFSTVSVSDPSDVSLNEDREWNTEVRLRLVPHPKAKHPETISLDYGITDGAKYVTLRACLVGYFLRHWHIDFSDEATGDPKAQQLFLDNKRDLREAGVPNWAFEQELS